MELLKKFENLVAWTARKGKMVKSHYEKKYFPPCKKGQIFWCDMGTNIGVEIDKPRPVVIWQNAKIGSHYSTVVIPLTHTIKPEHERKKTVCDFGRKRRYGIW